MADTIKALEASLQTATGGARVDALNELAGELKGIDHKRALELSEEAHRLALEMSDVTRQAYSLLNIGTFHIALSNHHVALSQLLQALPLFRAVDEKPGLGRTLANLAHTYYALGRYTDSLEYNFEALALSQGSGNGNLELVCLNNLGFAYYELGDFSTSMEYYLKSLQLGETLGEARVKRQSLNNIGLVYQELGQYEKAVAYHRESLTVSREFNDTWTEAKTLCSLGLTHYHSGRYQEALETYQEALAIARQIDYRKGESDAIGGLGLCYHALGRHGDALEAHRKSLALSREIVDPQGEAVSLYRIGSTYLALSDHHSALDNLRQSLSVAEELGAKKLMFQTHKLLAEAYELGGDLARALHNHKTFHALEKEVYNQEMDRRTKGLLVQHEVERAQSEAEIHRLKNVELAQVNEALKEADRQKSNLLNKLREQSKVLERQATEDALTKLHNRRYFDGQFVHEFSRARRFGHELSVAICDIDNFKAINDRFFHLIGDEVLKVVANLLVGGCRDVDTIARYGGEEFILLLPETSAEAAAVVCERVRKAVESYDWGTLDADLRVTISSGISDELAVARPNILLAAADAKLYEAKLNGKNQVRW
jgi:diguanylate cyclase (GGDEF)-like protein